MGFEEDFVFGHVVGFTRLYWVPAAADLISAVRGLRLDLF